MFNYLMRYISLTLAVILVLSIVGCKTATGNGSSDGVEYIVEEEIFYVEGDNNDANSSQENNNSQNSDNQQNSSQTQSDNNISVNPPYTLPIDYSGTTVKFAVTSDPMQSEKGPVIESFEIKYNIKIEPVIIKGDMAEELTGLYLADNSPDVVRSSGDFPLSLSYLQSLDTANINYDDPIWEQSMFKMSTFNGSPYMCTTVGNVYTEVDIVIYRKDILETAGCKTPEQYDKDGNWTIDSFFEIARQCAQKVEGVSGGSFLNYDSAIHMTGNSVFKYENGKFVNGMTNTAVDALRKISNFKNEGILSFNASKGIVDGTVAITTHHSYSLRKTGAFENNKDIWDKLGYYYLPAFSEETKGLKTGLFRGWGIVKGAKNPGAAGVFLRYYLDPGNFDLNDMYISSEASKFFISATEIDYKKWNPYFTYGNKIESAAGIKFYDDIYSVATIPESQIINKINFVNSKIDTGCKNINDYIVQILAAN